MVPADDVGQRMRRHFPALSPVTVAHEDDTVPIPKVDRHNGRAGRPKVCVAGAIGVHKGYEILLACAATPDGVTSIWNSLLSGTRLMTIA